MVSALIALEVIRASGDASGPETARGFAAAACRPSLNGVHVRDLRIDEEGATKAFCLVYQSKEAHSREVRESPGAQSAVKKELGSIVGQGVHDPYDTVEEWEVVLVKVDEACVVNCHLLVGIKGAELEPNLQKWKARLVAGGNNLRDANGLRVYEADLHGSPASLEAVRLVLAHAANTHDSALLSADVTTAYLQAELLGRPVYLAFPKDLWPPTWFHADGTPKYRKPVVRLRKAIYGLRRSGFDWRTHADTILQSQGWLPVVDHQEAMYMLPYIDLNGRKAVHQMVMYVDDLLAAGERVHLTAALEKLRYPDAATHK